MDTKAAIFYINYYNKIKQYSWKIIYSVSGHIKKNSGNILRYYLMGAPMLLILLHKINKSSWILKGITDTYKIAVLYLQF